MQPANQLAPLQVDVAGRLAKGREAQVLNAETLTHDMSSMAIVHWQIYLQPTFANKFMFLQFIKNTNLDAEWNYLQTDFKVELQKT